MNTEDRESEYGTSEPQGPAAAGTPTIGVDQSILTEALTPRIVLALVAGAMTIVSITIPFAALYHSYRKLNETVADLQAQNKELLEHQQEQQARFTELRSVLEPTLNLINSKIDSNEAEVTQQFTEMRTLLLRSNGK